MALATDDIEAATSSDLDGQDAASLHIGRVVAGTYRLTRHVGSGGSSHVFEAEHLRLGIPFAVKLLRTGLEGGRRAAQRFRREAKAVARLRSEHIVRVIDCGELDDYTPYLVMELLEGEDLRRLLNRERVLPARRAIQLVLEACLGLTEVHQCGLVHRDLKPENLFVARRSTGEDICKVLDFGVVKMESSSSTAQGTIVGTVRYMAPEQLANGASVGPATDIYALGAILYECLGGEPVHAGEAIPEVMFSVMNRAPSSLAALRPTLPRPLVDVVERCLAKQPSERLQSANELARLLESALEPRGQLGSADATLPEGARLAQPQPAPATSRSANVAITAALATLIGASAGWFIKPSNEAALPRPVTTMPEHARAAKSTLEAPSLAAASPAEAISATPPLPRRWPPIATTPGHQTPPATPATPPVAHPGAKLRLTPAKAAPSARNASQSAPSSGFDTTNPYGE